MMKKLDWENYEELVKDIYEELGKVSNVKILGYGKDCKRKGKSGVVHQIDVLTSHSDGMHDYLTDIECKFWEEKVNKDIVMKLKMIVDDCNFAKGIIVSKCGFTDDAITFAGSVGIGLVELREMTKKDWEGRIKNICINITFKSPIIISVQIEAKNIDSNCKEQNFDFLADGSKILINYPTEETETLSDFIKKSFYKDLYDQVEKQILTKEYTFNEGTNILYLDTKATYILHSIILTGKLDSYTVKMNIDGSNEILYIMKCIFENKEFTISKDGKINTNTLIF